MIRAAALLLFLALPAPAWVESVEFPWNTFPRQLWERELAWLKNIGITHVSLPPAHDSREPGADLIDVIRILRRLHIEGDIEGAVPESLQPQMRAHGGPLTDPLPSATASIDALAPGALVRSRRLLASGKPALLWTNVWDTIGPSGYHGGAVNFAGVETAATLPLRRDARLSQYWGQTLAALHEIKGAGTRLPAESISVQQFASDSGASFVSLINSSASSWSGDVKAMNPALKRAVFLPNVTVPAHSAAWLPVNVPLMAGPLCKACSAFATVDRLLYATAELTAMEYENGIIAMEFAAPAAGEAILQLSQEPSGPFMAGGKPTGFDWDQESKRVRLTIPAGKGTGDHVRIGLAIDAPDATAFFDSAQVLTIGETNRLVAQFSSESIGERSRLRTFPELETSRTPTKEPLQIAFDIKVPPNVVHGDHADLALEADGSQMSHARPQFLLPATLRFADAISVRLAPNSALLLSPAVIPVNQRAGREFSITLRNNAPEIRTFHVEIKADGLAFSPEKMDVPVGASASRDLSFRVFATGASPGLHAGSARVSGGAVTAEPVRFVVIPPNGAAAFAADGFSFIENAKTRASFLPGRWIEYLNKDNGQNQIAIGGIPFTTGTIKVRDDALELEGSKIIRLSDLEQLASKPHK